MRARTTPIALLLLPALVAVTQPAPAWAQDQDRRVVNGDMVVEAGETIDDIVVIGGDLVVRGEVTGDATVFGGNIVLESSGSILGDARVTGGEFLDQGGQILGEMRTLDGSGPDIAREMRDVLDGIDLNIDIDRDEIRDRRELAVGAGERDGRDRGSSIGRGFAGLVSTIAFALLLAGIGMALVFYGRPYLETVSDTVRGATLRSGATGIAASFLVLPAFVVMIVALAVSIVGIPLLLVMIPLYPLAVFAAAALGLLGVAHAVGERTAEQSRHPFDMRYRNSYAYLFTGVAMVVTPLIAANLLSMTGFLGFLGSILHVVTFIAIWIGTSVGLGAVILSRGGTRRTFAPSPPDAGYDGDDFFADDANGSVSDA